MSNESAVQTQFDKLIVWARQFNELSMRERALVSAGVLGITWALWLFVIDQQLSDSRAHAKRDLKMVKAELTTNKEARQTLLQAAAQDPNQPLLEQLAEIRTELNALSSQLKNSLSQFIPPQSMTLVLRDLIAEHKNVQLTLLTRLPARKLLPDEQDTNLYLHPMQLELKGEYLDVLDYLGSLENGDWQFNWQSFEFKTKGYPMGVATLEIETLSKGKHWLGL